jgi:hypothetical protein
VFWTLIVLASETRPRSPELPWILVIPGRLV